MRINTVCYIEHGDLETLADIYDYNETQHKKDHQKAKTENITQIYLLRKI